MTVCRGRYYSEDMSFRKTGLLQEERLNRGITLYEVIRVQEGCCLFLEDHFQRLQESVFRSGRACMVTLTEMRGILHGLIRRNGLYRGNIRISLHYPDDERPVLYTYFIPHYYPGADQYRNGVHTGLFPAVRLNPNVKQQHAEMRDRLTEFISSRDLYEALLVNEKGWITEGSRSNVFFIGGEILYTPPGDQVLKGITRKKIFDLCIKLNFKLLERVVSTEELSQMQGAFLTGTSPKVLPIRSIGTCTFRVSHPKVLSLMQAYDELITWYIQQQRSKG